MSIVVDVVVVVVGMDVVHSYRYIIVVYVHREHIRFNIYRLLSDGGKKKKTG